MFLLRPRELLLTVPSLPRTSDRTDDELDERATDSPPYLLSSATERLFRPRVTSATLTVKCVLFPQSVRFALSRRPTFGSRVLKRCDGLAAAGRFFEQGFAVRHERPGTRRHRRPSYGVVVSFIIRQQRSYVIILINPRAAIYVQRTEASVPDHRVCVECTVKYGRGKNGRFSVTSPKLLVGVFVLVFCFRAVPLIWNM